MRNNSTLLQFLAFLDSAAEKAINYALAIQLHASDLRAVIVQFYSKLQSSEGKNLDPPR